MRRRSVVKRAPVNMALFPFLAVLICTMGALIVLLVVVMRQAKASAEMVALETAPSVPEEEREKLKEAYEDALWRKSVLEQERDAEQQSLETARGELAHIEDHIRRLGEEAKLLKKQLDALREDGSKGEVNVVALKQEQEDLQKKIEDAKKQLADEKAKVASQKPAYSIIPFDGKNGTTRRPIYIECDSSGITLQPEGVQLLAGDFAGPLGPGNPLDAALRAAREHFTRLGLPGDAYPLLVVRPSGAHAYHVARQAMRSWENEFGYELVTEDMSLKYGKPDRSLIQVYDKAIAQARIRQRALADALPGRFRDLDQASFQSDAEEDDDPSFPGQREWAEFKQNPKGGGSQKGSGSKGSGGKVGGLDGGSAIGGTGLGKGQKGNGNGGFGDGGLADGDGSRLSGGDGYGAGRGNGSFAMKPSGGFGDSGYVAGQESGGNGKGIGRETGRYSSGSSRHNGTARANGAAKGNREGAGNLRGDSGGDGANSNEFATGNSGSGNDGSGSRGGRGSSVRSSAVTARDDGISGSDGSSGFGPSGAGSGAQGMGSIGAGAPNTASFGTPSGSGNSAQSGASSRQRGSQASASGPSRSGSKSSGAWEKAERRRRSGLPDWALQNNQETPTWVTRPIRIQCRRDRLVLEPDAGDTHKPLVVPIENSAEEGLPVLIEHVLDRRESWGDGVDWKPVLVVDVAENGETRYQELRTALKNSGLEIKRRSKR